MNYRQKITARLDKKAELDWKAQRELERVKGLSRPEIEQYIKQYLLQSPHNKNSEFMIELQKHLGNWEDGRSELNELYNHINELDEQEMWFSDSGQVEVDNFYYESMYGYEDESEDEGPKTYNLGFEVKFDIETEGYDEPETGEHGVVASPTNIRIEGDIVDENGNVVSRLMQNEKKYILDSWLDKGTLARRSGLDELQQYIDNRNEEWEEWEGEMQTAKSKAREMEKQISQAAKTNYRNKITAKLNKKAEEEYYVVYTGKEFCVTKDGSNMWMPCMNRNHAYNMARNLNAGDVEAAKEYDAYLEEKHTSNYKRL